MFGIGTTELLIIGVVLLLAVGPSKLPKLVKSLVRTYRDFQKATRELRASSGIDDLLQDEDLKELKELRKPINLDPLPHKPVAQSKPKAAPIFLDHSEREREQPYEGIDVVEAEEKLLREAAEENPDEVRRAKMEAAGITDEDEQAAIRDAKLAAAEQHEPLSEEELSAIKADKIAAAEAQKALSEEEKQAIINRKIAASEEKPAGSKAEAASEGELAQKTLAFDEDGDGED